MSATLPRPALELPEASFLKKHPTEHSNVDEAVKYFGRYYAEQAANVCGGRRIGDVLRAMSRCDAQTLFEKVHRCCRNANGGKLHDSGYVVPLINCRAADALMQLIILARQHPELFASFDVQIDVASIELHKIRRALGKACANDDDDDGHAGANMGAPAPSVPVSAPAPPAQRRRRRA